mmetsp:Transcript_35906/g.81012  ORF Transcript_35906/g.81012 Transcript_35906/m.81012 type:complete len:679 (+) Transcript_35906:56-2092(+)
MDWTQYMQQMAAHMSGQASGEGAAATGAAAGGQMDATAWQAYYAMMMQQSAAYMAQQQAAAAGGGEVQAEVAGAMPPPEEITGDQPPPGDSGDPFDAFAEPPAATTTTTTTTTPADNTFVAPVEAPKPKPKPRIRTPEEIAEALQKAQAAAARTNEETRKKEEAKSQEPVPQAGTVAHAAQYQQVMMMYQQYMQMQAQMAAGAGGFSAAPSSRGFEVPPTPAEAAAALRAGKGVGKGTGPGGLPIATHEGVLKRWVTEKGYGFVSPKYGIGEDKPEDLFLHGDHVFDALTGAQTTVEEGDRVAYVIMESAAGRPAARFARKVDEDFVLTQPLFYEARYKGLLKAFTPHYGEIYCPELDREIVISSRNVAPAWITEWTPEPADKVEFSLKADPSGNAGIRVSPDISHVTDLKEGIIIAWDGADIGGLIRSRECGDVKFQFKVLPHSWRQAMSAADIKVQIVERPVFFKMFPKVEGLQPTARRILPSFRDREIVVPFWKLQEMESDRILQQNKSTYDMVTAGMHGAEWDETGPAADIWCGMLQGGMEWLPSQGKGSFPVLQRAHANPYLNARTAALKGKSKGKGKGLPPESVFEPAFEPTFEPAFEVAPRPLALRPPLGGKKGAPPVLKGGPGLKGGSKGPGGFMVPPLLQVAKVSGGFDLKGGKGGKDPGKGLTMDFWA